MKKGFIIPVRMQFRHDVFHHRLIVKAEVFGFFIDTLELTSGIYVAFTSLYYLQINI